jgi:hypothetical protein
MSTPPGQDPFAYDPDPLPPKSEALPPASPHEQPPPYAGSPAYPPYPYALPRRTNGLAVASLVLGVVWIYWIGSILALIFGYVARKQIRERGDSGDGLAIAGIVLGWVGIGIVVIVMVVAGLAGGLPS